MAYRIDPNPRFWAKVTVPTLGESGAEQDFRACFKALDTDEFNSYDLNDPAEAQNFLVATLVDVDDVLGGAGAPLPFTAGLRDTLIRTPHIRQVLMRAYMKAFETALAGN